MLQKKKTNETRKRRSYFPFQDTFRDRHGWYGRSESSARYKVDQKVAIKFLNEKFFEMWKDADKDLPALIAAKKEYAELN